MSHMCHDFAPQPSGWNISSSDETRATGVDWPRRSYHVLTARLRRPSAEEMTAWCHPFGRKSASPAESSHTVGDALYTVGWLEPTSSSNTLIIATFFRCASCTVSFSKPLSRLKACRRMLAPSEA